MYRVFCTRVALTGCGCSAMQQLKQTQNSVILRPTKKPQQFPLSAHTPLLSLFLFAGNQNKKKEKKIHKNYPKKKEKKKRDTGEELRGVDPPACTPGDC